jgi:hypothetical protein
MVKPAAIASSCCMPAIGSAVIFLIAANSNLQRDSQCLYAEILLSAMAR